MRTSTTTFVLASLLFLGTSTTAVLAQMGTPDSQGGNPPAVTGQRGYRMQPPDATKQLARMTARLNLTADQQAQIKPILENRNQQCSALQADTSLAGPDKMAKMKSIHEDTSSKLNAIFNDQQKQQWTLRQQQRGVMPGCMQMRMGGRGSGQPMSGQ